MMAVSRACKELLPSREVIWLTVAIGICTAIVVGPPAQQEAMLRRKWRHWVIPVAPNPAAQVVIGATFYVLSAVVANHVIWQLPLLESVCAGQLTVIGLLIWRIKTLEGATPLVADITETFNDLIDNLDVANDNGSDDHDGDEVEKGEVWDDLTFLRDNIRALPSRYFDTTWSTQASEAIAQWMVDSDLETRTMETIIPESQRAELSVIMDKYEKEFTTRVDQMKNQ
jgi:hypothetical protein